MTDHTVAWPWQSGGGGLYSTAGDYLHFCQMLLDHGRSPNAQILSPATIRLMISDHLPAGITWDSYTPSSSKRRLLRATWTKLWFGFALRTHSGVNPLPGSIGDYFWAGAFGTYFWIDPAEKLIAIFMSQAPELRLHYRYLMRQLVYQAIELSDRC